MATATESASECPFAPSRDDVGDHGHLLQGGAGAATFDVSDPDETPVLDGDPHRQERGALARFFTPKAAALLLGVAGLGGWASLSRGGPESAAFEASAGVELEWKYRYAGGEAGRAAIEDAIDEAIADMSGLIRGIARRKLLEANEIIDAPGFSVRGDPLRASNIGGRIIESPASGVAVDWVDQFGDAVKVSQRWSDGELVQRIFNDDGSRTNVYRFAEDGQSMTMSVTIEASRLPKPIRYRLDYRKREP